ncbi:MAG: ABC transporter ATP-binding protein [Lentisphaeria bacterium]|nr:ABC transporter ATP-binding protein [Lentisphaeria bacterium]
MAASVKIEGISKSYKKNSPVLLPLDLEIKAGELFFLLGPSGCGKSTLLRMIAGLLEPTSGKIFFDGQDITALPPEKRQAAMVFQNYALWPHLTVFDNVAFGLRVAGVPKAELVRRTEEALKLVRMHDFADRRVPSLSGGQQQRVALARAVAVSPRVLLLDEPLSNLDAKLRDEMRMEISRICRERELTAIYVTHDRREALSMGDRIALLDKGRIQQIGSPVELYRNPRTRFAAAFLGGVNFIEAKIVEKDGRRYAETGIGTFLLEHDTGGRTAGTLLIRPETIRLSVEEGAPNTFRAEYHAGTFLGERSELQFKAAGGTILEVTASTSEIFRPGQSCLLQVDPHDLVLLED